jgi:hypothetical protein
MRYTEVPALLGELAGQFAQLFAAVRLDVAEVRLVEREQRIGLQFGRYQSLDKRHLLCGPTPSVP